MANMQNKVCIVTGAAGSIGLASARLLLEAGARVLLVDSDEAGLNKAIASLDDMEHTAAVCVDISDGPQVRQYIQAAMDRWERLDVVFSNAGIFGVVAPIVDYPEDVFDDVLRVNLRASFLACKYALPVMRSGGSIILTSSIMGVTADPGVCAYITSKHALVGLMRCAAKEAAGRNIRVNVLAPGPVDNRFQDRIEDSLSEAIGKNVTDLINKRIPLGRHAQAEEIAQSVLFLASDQSSFCTGGVYMADGGMHI